MMTATTQPTPEMWPAREAYDLSIYERSPYGLRTLVGDGQGRYWINSSALAIEVPVSLGNGEADAEAYARWCRDGRAEQA